MKWAVLAVIAMVWAVPALAQLPPGLPGLPDDASLAAPSGAAPTAKDAQDFIARVEAELVVENEYSNRISWVAATFINDDTNWLSARVSAELSTRSVRRA